MNYEENGKISPEVKEAAYMAALRYIKYKPRSVLEVGKKLKSRGYSPVAVEGTIIKLLEENLLDDLIFARMWAKERAEAKNFGPARIKNELCEKGIDKQIITEVLEELSGDENPVDRAVKMLYRKLRIIEQKDDRTLISYLIRGGYNFTDAKEAVRRVRKGE